MERLAATARLKKWFSIPPTMARMAPSSRVTTPPWISGYFSRSSRIVPLLESTARTLTKILSPIFIPSRKRVRSSGLGSVHRCCSHLTRESITGSMPARSISPVRFCLPPSLPRDTSIEGLSEKNDHPVQQAWKELDVAQCGYCQTGQIMAAAALLSKNNSPTDNDVNEAMAAVICRCGTYTRIKKAIQLAASKSEK